MFDQQKLYEAALQSCEAAENTMSGVNDRKLWREVYRLGGYPAECRLSGDEPGLTGEPFGDEPEILPGSQPAKAIELVMEAEAAIMQLQEPRLRAAAHARLVMVNGFMGCAGDLEMPLCGCKPGGG